MDNFTPQEFHLAPATLGSNELTLVWEKGKDYLSVTSYRVYQDNRCIAIRKPEQTHITIQELKPETTYEFSVESIVENKEEHSKKFKTKPIKVTTLALGLVIDVTKEPYNVDPLGKKIGTLGIQKAIDDCPVGGTVWIPPTAQVLSGALELHSNMILRVDGILSGSKNPEDYRFDKSETHFLGTINKDGLVLSRYEGWELFCYRSLLNIGYLDQENRTRKTCTDVRITGEGKIIGGGNDLGFSMRKIYADVKRYPDYVSDGIPGRRARGRLICCIQAQNIHITGVTIMNPPCWTIHMIYCDTITTNGIKINSRGIDNGDGWDPDSSRNCLIFDTVFNTGDDCIAIKSGKNPQGNYIGIPTENIRIFNLEMLEGNGMAIGSEQSGGVRNVSLRDCIIQNTRYGLELKAHNDRGGFIEDIKMTDCVVDHFLAHSVLYNSDGQSASNLPVFQKITIKNTFFKGKGKLIELIGFEKRGEEKSPICQVRFENIVIDNTHESKEINLKLCSDVQFQNVQFQNGMQPDYIVEKDTVRNLLIK